MFDAFFWLVLPVAILEGARHRREPWDGVDVLLCLDVYDVDRFVRGVGDINPAGGLMNSGMIEAAALGMGW